MTSAFDSPELVDFHARVPADAVDELTATLMEIMKGARPRLQARETAEARITARALEALQLIAAAIDQHQGTGQARRLVAFVAGLYNGHDYPFDLTELRALDADLASACLDYLNYDRLGHREVHQHLPDGERQLHGWLARYGFLPAPSSGRRGTEA